MDGVNGMQPVEDTDYLVKVLFYLWKLRRAQRA